MKNNREAFGKYISTLVATGMNIMNIWKFQGEVPGSSGSKYEDGSLLGHSAL
jgi:hypothetical protein